jgi:ribosome biogenesis ATPase
LSYRPDNIDPGVRGRFSREVSLPVPDAFSRTKILQLATSAMRLATDVDLTSLGKLTPGFVGADLNALAREAGMIAVTRIVQSKNLDDADDSTYQDLFVEMNDFVQASKTVQPTAKREGFAVVPNVTWNDVGALEEVREELLHNVLEPISNPEKFKSLGLEIPAGVLFFGPPGCGKTLLAKAMANQSGANFISVKGPELFNMYVGESESKVRQVFSRARSSTPCVIFFDELDALCPKRGSSSDGNNVSERVVNQVSLYRRIRVEVSSVEMSVYLVL